MARAEEITKTSSKYPVLSKTGRRPQGEVNKQIMIDFVKKYFGAIFVIGILLIFFGWAAWWNLSDQQRMETSIQEYVRLVHEGSRIRGAIVDFQPFRVDTTNESGVSGREGINVAIEYSLDSDERFKLYEVWPLSEDLLENYKEGDVIDLHYLPQNSTRKISSPFNEELQNALQTVVNRQAK